LYVDAVREERRGVGARGAGCFACL